MPAEGGASSVVGRDHELKMVDAFLDIPTVDRRVLVLDGEAGIGKTTLWLEAVRRAADRGFRVLSCRPAQTETALAGAALCDLLAEVNDEALAVLPEVQRRALQVALLRAEPGTAHLEARVVAAAFRSLIESLSAEQCVLVAIDDEQWLDRASATTIGFALRRLQLAPVGWLVTHRLGATRRLDTERIVPPESCTHLTVGPLTVGALHGVLKRRSSHSFTRPTLVRLHQASGGNPFYALGIAREMQSRGDNTGTAPFAVPSDLLRLIAGQVRRLPEATRRELVVCAALASPNVVLVNAGALEPAREREIVTIDGDGRIWFRHPLFASAVYELFSPNHRRELHSRLAEVVGDREEQARHLVLASAAPDERVADAAEEGAALGRERGSWETAAELLEHAARLTPPDLPKQAQGRTVAAAEHHVHAGNRPRARVLLEAVLVAPVDDRMRAEALRLLAEVSYNDDRFPEASRLYKAALDVATDPRLTIEILLGISYVDAQMWEQLWDFPGASAYARRALAIAEEIGDGPLLAEALGYSAMLDFLCGRGIDRPTVERALTLEDPSRVVPVERRPSTMAALLALYDGRHAEARVRLDVIRESVRLQGDESDLPFVLTWRSWLETRAGNFADAGEFADEAASLATLTGSRSMHAWALAQRAYVNAHLGDVEATRLLCGEATALLESSGYLQPGTWIAAAITLLELSLGDAASAWHASRPLVEALETAELWEPIIGFMLPDAIEALIALGEVDRARPLIETLEGRGRELDRAWAVSTGARCRGILLAACGDLHAAFTALDEASDHHEAVDMPMEHARTLLVTGRVERRARRRGDASATLERALTLFEQAGAALWAGQVRAELDRSSLRRVDSEVLTVAERRVADLAVRGLTNREIAAELFMSPKTVEAHIGHIYRKLGIRSRAQLGASIAQVE